MLLDGRHITVDDIPTISQRVEIEFSYDIDICPTDDPIYMKHPEKANPDGKKVETSWDMEEWGVEANMYWISFGSDENYLKLDIRSLWLCEYTKNYWTMYFKEHTIFNEFYTVWIIYQ